MCCDGYVEWGQSDQRSKAAILRSQSDLSGTCAVSRNHLCGLMTNYKYYAKVPTKVPTECRRMTFISAGLVQYLDAIYSIGSLLPNVI